MRRQSCARARAPPLRRDGILDPEPLLPNDSHLASTSQAVHILYLSLTACDEEHHPMLRETDIAAVDAVRLLVKLLEQARG